MGGYNKAQTNIAMVRGVGPLRKGRLYDITVSFDTLWRSPWQLSERAPAPGVKISREGHLPGR
jgi:hypothetical protein